MVIAVAKLRGVASGKRGGSRRAFSINAVRSRRTKKKPAPTSGTGFRLIALLLRQPA
jgi:hypothetical protein